MEQVLQELRGRYRNYFMTPFEVYTKYIALKNHFSQERYDYFTYGGKVRAKESSFEIRKDKYFFYKLSKHKDIENFLLANIPACTFGCSVFTLPDKISELLVLSLIHI